MFKKKPQIKTLAPLRSSDRRKITDQIIAEYQLEIPRTGAIVGEDEANGNSGIGELRNSLLPEGCLSAKFSTTAGQDLKTVTGIIYVGTLLGEEPRILWIRLEDRMIPTVYTLWCSPGIVPLIHTPDIVLRKMQGGADLMTPGLARGPPFPSKATKNSVVAVASLDKPSVPLVVGLCEIDIGSLSQVQGAKGHAVRGLHWEGDEIWSWSQAAHLGRPAPNLISGWEDADLSLSHGVESLTVEDSDSEAENGGVALDNKARNEHIDGEDVEPFKVVESSRPEMSTKEIDDAFRNAFSYSIYNARSTHPRDVQHGINFPIQLSQLMSNFMLPFLPIFTAEDANDLQIKKTSWKNIKKFVKFAEKERLLKSKDRNGGETVIIDIQFESPAFINFVPYRLPPKKGQATGHTIGDNETTAGLNGSATGDSSIGQELKLITLLKPNDRLAPILSSTEANAKSFYLLTDLHKIMVDYFESESLVDTTNKRLVNLNLALGNAVFDSQNAIDEEVLANGRVPRDVLLERIARSCTSHWIILRNAQTRESVKAKAGQAPTVKVLLETRSGSKTVTRVSGVEHFFINPQTLSDELQKACASSTSVAQLVGTSPKNPVMEIMIQGPQKEIVTKALEKRGVHRNWVEITDKTKSKKK